MANDFTNVNLNTFFDKLDGGATWSAGVAFKRAAALPLERYEVHKSYEDALAYATTNAVAYPGQVIAVVKNENGSEKIKIYFIDENKGLQEVGSATLGDNVTIVLDPLTKKLSLKGFENAGYVATKDEVPVKNKSYFVLADEKYVVVTEVAENPKEASYFERVAVKLIKDSNGNLAWVTDDAVQIQGDIAALQTTVGEHATAIERIDGEIDALEKKHGEDLEDVNEKITSLGSVLNFVGTLTVAEFAATTGSDNIIDADKTIPAGDRAYRVGDVVFVVIPVSDTDSTIKYTQEYVATSTEGGLVWEAFGDPTGITGLESKVSGIDARLGDAEDAIADLEEVTSVIGVEAEGENPSTGLYLYAEEKATNALNTAKTYTDDEIDKVELLVSANKEAIEGADGNGGLKAQVATNKDDIATIRGELDTASTGIYAKITNLENGKADKTEVQGVANELTTLSGNVYTKTEVNNTLADYATKTVTNGLDERLGNVESKANTNESNLSTLSGKVDGISNTVTELGTASGTHTSQIEALQTGLGTANENITKAQGDATKALGDAAKAQGDATQALADAATAKGIAEQGVADAATAKGIAEQGVTDAAAAKEVADAADALSKANQAKFDSYSTTEQMNAAIQAVVTNGADTKDSDTVKGAKLYTDDKINTVNEAIGDLQDEIGNLTNVMNFIGVSETDPSLGTVTINGEVIEPQLGDVVVFEAFEYVYAGATKGWEIFGNVTADETRFEGIEEDIVDLDERVETIENKINDTTDTDGNTVKGIASRLSDVEVVAGNAAKASDLTGEITRATERENEIALSITNNKAAQDLINTDVQNSIDAIINAETGLLAWGTF